MYNPSAFLIASAALTSIFSFFFGGYYQNRDNVYALWVRVVAYGADFSSEEEEARAICGELESKERLLKQAKGLLAIIVITLIAEFLVFQVYSFPYVSPLSPKFSHEAYHNYRWYNTIIGIIILINCLEMLYIRVAVDYSPKFPFFRLRKRVSGQERLSAIWRTLGCKDLKLPEFDKMRIPTRFYKDLENENKEPCEDEE
jgi:hypothetical protein